MERTELMTELAELLRAHSRVVRSHLAETLADHGLTPPQLWALHNVAEPCSMGELAGALGVDASYVTALADSLQDKGLVERRPSADDRRRRVLEITDDGRAILDGMHAKVASVPIGGDLGDEELAELVGLLRRAVAAVDRV
jgi:DNA-binding MarR family transcriptional regulator